MRRFRAKWWQAALFAAGVVALERVARTAGKGADPRFYDAVKRPSWSPPSWLLGPAFAALATTQLASDVRLLNRRSRGPALFALSAASWVALLAATPALYRLKSPRLAFASNLVQAAATAARIVLAGRVDPTAALALAPNAAWLGYALPVSGWIAARNADPFLHQPALR